MFDTTISVDDSSTLLALFGPRDQFLRTIREALGVSITAREEAVRVSGEDVAAVTQATSVLEHLIGRVRQAGHVTFDEVNRALGLAEASGPPLDGKPQSQTIEVMNAGRRIRPRTPGQAEYIDAILENDIVFAVGPAGTGKTYLAVAMAVAALRQELVRKIVLVRPAVEAGESLGYLPGDLQAKLNPYLRPLMDALREMIDFELMKRYMERDLIEIIPLAYMRGRSLNEAFIILDEAQNTTVAQMKMFLTRMGHGSKIVASGDVTQIDLPPRTRSGLIDAMARLSGIRGLAHVRLSNADIVRNPLVQKIVEAYEQGESKRH